MALMIDFVFGLRAKSGETSFQEKSYNMTITKENIQPIFLLGFPRCATSTFTSILAKHSEIVFPDHGTNKSTDFFSTDEYLKGKDFLLSNYYSGWNGQQHLCDANPVHSFLPFVAKRIYDTFPNAKLIVSMRNPVERAYSNWWHNREAAFENSDFETTVMDEMKALESMNPDDESYWMEYRRKMLGSAEDWRSNIRFYLWRGYYALHIKRYLEYFSSDQIHYIVFEEFRKDNKNEIDKLSKFLEIETKHELEADQHVNYAVKNEAVASFVRKLDSYKLKKVIPKSLKRGLKKTLSKQVSETRMSDDMRNLLESYYREKNVELAELTKLNVDAWK